MVLVFTVGRLGCDWCPMGRDVCRESVSNNVANIHTGILVLNRNYM